MSKHNHAGINTTCKYIIPNYTVICRLARSNISREAKHRLEIIEHYLAHSRNASLTCRHFDITRSYLYKWLKRFNPRNLKTLESRSRKPHHVRSPQYTYAIIARVRLLRQQHPTLSAKKLAVMLAREAIMISAATIGRIIKRFNLFFSRVIAARKRRSNLAKARWQKKRKPYALKSVAPHTLIEFDMKHIHLSGNATQYAFCAIDPYTKESLIHIASTPSSQNARVAIEKVIARFGEDITIVNDNGSENMGKVYEYLQSEHIEQLFTRPYEPKDKPYIENFIGKYQAECLNESIGEPMLIPERQAEADRFLDFWHNIRPHQALGYATPAEYCAKMNITIPRTVSTM